MQYSFQRSFLVLSLCTAAAISGCSEASTEDKDPLSSDDPDAAASVPDAGNPQETEIDSGSTSTEPAREWTCIAAADEEPDYLRDIGCAEDFEKLASRPIDASIPGARSLKTSIDRDDNMTLNFQNSVKYPIHWNFVSEQRSVNQGLPLVPSLSEFNISEYYAPSRRFILGALTYYEGPQKWTYEIAPYDTADVEMVSDAFRLIAEHTYIGDELYFHPTSSAIETLAADLPADVPIVTTEELFLGIDYQPLNPAESIGQLRFVNAADLETEFVGFRDIVVLDRVPNDISVTQGIITQEFQTPLAHINVLSQNRGTPNMALRNATTDEELVSLEGKWVRLTVGLSDYDIEEVTKAEADAWWDEHKPAAVQVPGLDLEKNQLTDCPDMIDPEAEDLRAEFKAATRAFGGKAGNYAGLTHIEGLPVPKAFGIPVFFYMQFMEENGFDQRVVDMLADEEFQNSAEARDAALEALRADMEVAPVNADFEAALAAKLDTEFNGLRMRFRSSTNAEDLDGFTGAGLYTSRSGDPADDMDLPLDAIRKVWASVWFFRAFEERSYRSIDHLAVGMALLVHRSFPEEEANGVALTGNPFDKTGVSPAFYVNVQVGEASVVQPENGVTTDQYLQYFDLPGQPVTYLSESNLAPSGTHVLTTAQVHELGAALDSIRTFFAPAYQQNPWWSMDVEFKFDGEPGETPALVIKQARPFGNR
jgi:pyruvate, water dikinase